MYACIFQANILLEKMPYFAKATRGTYFLNYIFFIFCFCSGRPTKFCGLTPNSLIPNSGQLLSDVDITVHCDVHIFEWLTRWMISPNNPPLLGQQLEMYPHFPSFFLIYTLLFNQSHQMWYQFCFLLHFWKQKRSLRNA